MPTAPDSTEPQRQAEGRRPVLASGCGAVSTFQAEPTTVEGSLVGRAMSDAPQMHGPPAPRRRITVSREL